MISQVNLSPSGPQLSRLIPGLMRLMEWQLDAAGLQQWILRCLEMGYSSFDHADIYGGHRCEAAFGEALARQPGLRAQIQLISKCDIRFHSSHNPDVQTKHYDSSRGHILASVENSLRNLHSDYLDLLLLHRPDYLLDRDEVAEAFSTLKQAGKVRYFGVSNFSASQFESLQQALDFPLVTNQIEFSVLHLAPLDDGTLDQAQRWYFSPLVWSPLAGGRIFQAADERSSRVKAALAEVGAAHNTDALDVIMLAWILRHPAKPLPILGTGKLERLQRAAQAEAIQLSREQWYRIWEASIGHPVP